MRPSSMTRMTSAPRMVDRRWAITKLVRWSASRFMASWICTSVRVSTELVASSRMRIDGSGRKARAMVSSCFWPALMLSASSLIRVSYPSGSEWTKRST